MKSKALVIALTFLTIASIFGFLGASSDSRAWQAAYANTQQFLQNTRSELQGVKNSLDSASQNIAFLENKNRDLDAKVVETNNKLSASEQDKLKLQTQLGDLQKNLSQTQDKLKLYEDTLGTKVFTGARPPYSAHNPVGGTSQINLINNPKATDLTYDELKKFLFKDTTDETLYNPASYVCGDYAEDLHNNAEKAGIRAAFVAIHFQGSSPPHALNAFKTTDQGLVYIDDTGDYERLPAHADKRAFVEKGKPLYEDFIWAFYYALPWGMISSIEIYW